MNEWLALDADVRTAWVALVGLLLGVCVNWAVSSLAYEPRYFSPWSRKHPRDGRSVWLDRLPIVGWIWLQRKGRTFGRGFWLRPLMVEAGMAAGCAGLYRWEVLAGGLLPPGVPPTVLPLPVVAYPLHFTFVAHVLLLAFMAAASLIDFDELSIPDKITVPGTLAGLAWMTFVPSFLPGGFDREGRMIPIYSIFPFRHPLPTEAYPNVGSLAIVLACYLLWCGGLLDRPWRTSRGYGVALRLLAMRVRQAPTTPWILLLAVVGSAFVVTVWLYEPGRWLWLGTALIGLAVGGAMVWVTRVIGTWALRQEAMGFGDVTLMAMIGAYVGWQAAVLIFFAAPAMALVFGGLKWLVTRDNAFCYGPFLCLAAGAVVVGWSPVWQWAAPRFEAGWLIPSVLVVGFGLLWAVLALLRWVRMRGA